MAVDQLSVFVHRDFVIVFGQRNDCFINDARYNTIVRSDATESGADFNVDGDFLEYWWHTDASRRSAKCDHRIKQRHH